MPFVKLDCGILESSVWCEDSDTRVVWITLLAMADANGFVHAKLPGISAMARVPIDTTRQALAKFQETEEHSRTGDGRRIVQIDGGFAIVNYSQYRAKRDPEERRRQVREAVARHRNKQTDVINVSRRKPQKAQAEAEAEAEAEVRKDIAATPRPAVPNGESKPAEGGAPTGTNGDGKQPRPADPIWDEVVLIFFPGGAVGSEKRIGKIVRDLKAKGAEAGQIRRRKCNLIDRWGPGVQCTPEALVKHWSSREAATQHNGTRYMHDAYGDIVYREDNVPMERMA